jgi:hypothetical protein
MVLETFRQRPVAYATYRALAAMGEPVGDPFGGPAYGQKNGPALALVGAGASIWGGMAIGASTLMGGLMIAGGVMSGLGAITGNKTLSTLGMVAGLAGGVGSFFQNGGFGSMTGGVENIAGGGTAETVAAAQSEIMPSWASGAADPAAAAMAAEPASVVMQSNVTRDIMGGGIMGGGSYDPVMSGVGDIGNAAAMSAGGAAPDVGAAAVAAGGAPTTGGGLMGDFFKSDMAKYGAIQAGGGLLKGLGESDAADKKLAQDKEYMDQRMSNESLLTQKKMAGVPMASIGTFGTNKDAAVFGKNADGSPATREQYVNAWRSYYSTPQTTQGVTA